MLGSGCIGPEHGDARCSVMKDNMKFKFLVYSRTLRSVALIYMALASPLYLNLIGMNVADIGIVYAGLMLFLVFMNFFLGMLGDRFGYKKALILGEVPPLLGSLLMWHSSSIYLIVLAVVIGGIGGLAGGFRGIFSAGMTAIIVSNYPKEQDRVKKMSTLIRYAALGSVAGGVLLLSQTLLQTDLGDVGAYRMLFLISALFIFSSFVSLIFIKEKVRPRKTTKIMRRSSLSYTLRVIYLNAINGFGLGLAIPLLPLFFKLAFHLHGDTTAAIIGMVYIPAYLASSAGARFYGIHPNRLGIVNVASISRSISGVLLMAMGVVFAVGYTMPYSTWLFAAAALLYIARSFIGGIGVTSISIVNLGGVHNEDYGTASSIQGIAGSLSMSSSGLSGYLVDLWMPAPLFLGGLFQIGGGILYKRALGKRYSNGKK